MNSFSLPLYCLDNNDSRMTTFFAVDLEGVEMGVETAICFSDFPDLGVKKAVRLACTLRPLGVAEELEGAGGMLNVVEWMDAR